jgi:hypothetical protein
VCTGCWCGSQRETGHWGDPDVDGDDIKMNLQKTGTGCGDWIESAQDRDRWWALVSTVKNLRVT